ncbi:MAG: thioredoxin family protein [Gammaproteobacteria bacterium]
MIKLKTASILLMTGLFLIASSAQSAVPRDPYKFFFTETFGDLTEDLDIAKEQGKKAVFVFFEMDECPFCHRMKQTVLNQPEVQDYFREHFHNLSIDIEGDVEIVDFKGNNDTMKDWAAKKHRVRATPMMAFFDLEGNRISKFVGAAANIQEFLWYGEFIVSGAYKDMRFSKYKRARQKAEAN